MSQLENMVSEIAKHVVAGIEVSRDTDTPFVRVPAGFSLKCVEGLQETPSRPRGTTAYADVKHFAEDIKGMAIESGPATVYGVINEKPHFVAIFNDNAWRDHRFIYNCPLSIEWVTWLGSDGKIMSQAEFAAFIEGNAPDCVDAAMMIEISRSLEAKRNVNFASAIRLDNGEVQFTYEENIQGTAQKGQLEVPQEFALNIPVLVGIENYEVRCRLRYRINDGGKMVMWYEVIRPHKIIEHATRDVIKVIKDVAGVDYRRVESIPAPVVPLQA